MQVNLSHPEFQAAIPILQRIEAAGFEAYFVGGCVRDALLNLPIHDVDIATSAYPEEVKRIFKRTVDTGIQHGTVMVLDHGAGYEVTTFRTESTYQDFRRPDEVTFVRSLKEDQQRRDFTVNALAARHDGTIIDNYGGLADLDAHLLRAVGDPQARFHEDALRMMRGVRFESQLGFSLEQKTATALAANAPLLKHIAVERIAAEFSRLLLGINRTAGLTSFINAKLYEYCPELSGQGAALERLAQLPRTQLHDVAVGWLLLAYELQTAAAPLLRAWKQPKALMKSVQVAQDILPKILSGQASAMDLYTAGATDLTVAVTAAQLLQPNVDPATYQQRYAALPMHAAGELAVNGGDLIKAGVHPGPALGTTLRDLEEAVVVGKITNTRAELLAHVQTGAKE
ncbi:CCA tRNA nucleotidyltransferase [Lacticaseibacillus zhaodongensis]|uniref:CCA tRNA nucleotidyltransferase n=1 Tax=Lacticaseibacillus zhaodongensis TaxID=2668065 RepID=UPI0012D2CD65|nr:CCA tRNA nucleotidyltransferase [Lacticaseibacillus zhaodongensis]